MNKLNKPHLITTGEKWVLPTVNLGAFQEQINENMIKFLTDVFNSEDTFLSFPIVWGGIDPNASPYNENKHIESALMVRLLLGFVELDDNPYLEFNIKESLSNYLESCKEDGSFREGLHKLAKEFYQLVQDIDEVTGSEPKSKLHQGKPLMKVIKGI